MDDFKLEIRIHIGLVILSRAFQSGDVEALVKEAVELGGGRLDVVVHAAGVQSIDDLLLTTDEEVAKVMAINVGGTANIIKYALSVLQGQKAGNMVIISSIAARVSRSSMSISSSRCAMIYEYCFHRFFISHDMNHIEPRCAEFFPNS